MKSETLADCLGGIDDQYIEEAAPGKRPAPKGRWALMAAAAVLTLVVGVRAVEWARWNLCDCAPPVPDGTEIIGDAPGHIRWHGGVYCDHGNAAYEMPEGLELLGEVNQVVPEGGIVPEDADDLSGNIEGYAYWFPGNESLIVFRYKDWDTSYAAVELGRQEPFLLMYREFSEKDFAGLDYPVYFHRFDMVEAADTILEGTVTAGPGDVHTLEATNVLKGNVEGGAKVQVELPQGDGRLEASGEGRYLLFLLHAQEDAPFRPVNPIQGVYPIERGYVYVAADDPGLGGAALPPYTRLQNNLVLMREGIRKDMEAARDP